MHRKEEITKVHLDIRIVDSSLEQIIPREEPQHINPKEEPQHINLKEPDQKLRVRHVVIITIQQQNVEERNVAIVKG